MTKKTNILLYEELSQINETIKDLENIKKELISIKDKVETRYSFLEDTITNLKKETNTKDNYENIQSLYTFDSFYDFKEFINELYNVNKWKISDLPDEERIEILKDRDYFKKLKQDFNSKKLSPYPITNKEILSYLDTLSILYKILEEVQNQDFKKNIKIIMEYIPKFDRGKDRCDYVLAYKDSLMLLEFGRCTDRSNLKKRKNEKDEQLDFYQKEIKKLVGDNIKIKSNPIIYMPEKDNNSIEENFDVIKENIHFIKRWINEANKNAIDFLNQADD